MQMPIGCRRSIATWPTVWRPCHRPDTIRVPFEDLDELKVPPPRPALTCGLLSRQRRFLGPVSPPAVDVHPLSRDRADVFTVACVVTAEFCRQLGCASGIKCGNEVATGCGVWRIGNVHRDGEV